MCKSRHSHDRKSKAQCETALPELRDRSTAFAAYADGQALVDVVVQVHHGQDHEQWHEGPQQHTVHRPSSLVGRFATLIHDCCVQLILQARTVVVQLCHVGLNLGSKINSSSGPGFAALTSAPHLDHKAREQPGGSEGNAAAGRKEVGKETQLPHGLRSPHHTRGNSELTYTVGVVYCCRQADLACAVKQ